MTFLYKPRYGGLPNMDRCRAEVSAGNWHWSQCSRPVKITRDGVGYCAQHDPVTRKEKNEARLVAWNQKWAQERAARDHASALAAFRCEAVETLRLIADGCNDARGAALATLAKEPKLIEPDHEEGGKSNG